MKKNSCGCLITLLIGIVLGIIIGYIEYITLIPGIASALWAGFIIGVVAFILLTLIALFSVGRKINCICRNGYCLTIPAVGAIITTIIGLSITITAEAIWTAVLIGLATLFLTMTILNLLKLILCLIDTNCEC